MHKDDSSTHSGEGAFPDAGVAIRRMPVAVSAADRAFGGRLGQILPPYADIPQEFKREGNPWSRWQQEWFFGGLTRWPVPKPGVDLRLAMANLQCVQNSFEPKHEHKQAGVAYLASLWFDSPDGTAIASATKGATS